jgi:hypothetical protein
MLDEDFIEIPGANGIGVRATASGHEGR